MMSVPTAPTSDVRAPSARHRHGLIRSLAAGKKLEVRNQHALAFFGQPLRLDHHVEIRAAHNHNLKILRRDVPYGPPSELCLHLQTEEVRVFYHQRHKSQGRSEISDF